MSKLLFRFWILLFCFSFVSINAVADVRLPALVGDGMVLQRDQAVNIWGWADPEERVQVEIGKHRLQTQADADGQWRVVLPEHPAGGPNTIEISGNNRITLSNVWFGDVWVASGQSNMELPMRRLAPLYQDELAAANDEKLRVFTVPQRYDFNQPQQDYTAGQWQPATPEVLREFSGVAYFFAKALRQSEGVPIGIINASLGGSPAQAWMSAEALEAFPHYLEQVKPFREAAYIERVETADRERINAWHAELNSRDQGMHKGTYRWAQPDVKLDDWREFKVPGAWSSEKSPFNGVVWLRKEIDVPEHLAGQPALLVMGKIIDSDKVFINGELVGETGYRYPPRRYPVPEGLLKAGPNTIAVRVVSDQGRGRLVADKTYELQWATETLNLEGKWQLKVGALAEPLASQTFVRWQPTGLFNAMLAPMLPYGITGAIWYQGESNVSAAEEYHTLFPAMIADWRRAFGQGDFPFLYVQLANYQENPPQPSDSEWARLREAQSATLALPNTAMVVTLDVGEWNDIHPIEKKVVGERLALAAQSVAYGEKVVHSGPRFKSMKIQGKRAILSFDQVGGGLTTSDGKPPGHFAIAGADKKFVWAKAEIRGNRVRVWSDQVKRPVAVRYGWADNPAGANLINKEGLPASSFRSDDW